MARLKLEDAVEIVKEIAGEKLELNVPDKLKEYSLEILNEKVQAGKELTEDEQDAAKYSNLIINAYIRATAVKSMKENYFADINEAGKALSEKYKKEE